MFFKAIDAAAWGVSLLSGLAMPGQMK